MGSNIWVKPFELVGGEGMGDVKAGSGDDTQMFKDITLMSLTISKIKFNCDKLYCDHTFTCEPSPLSLLSSLIAHPCHPSSLHLIHVNACEAFFILLVACPSSLVFSAFILHSVSPVSHCHAHPPIHLTHV